ncbi:hypothetical protein PSHT_04228 [Puccinia striiformis]|uniref:Uncharacterized protein n=1 Tax=Puccinia striiformis TaxID=27350 RepID=A0A2S4WDF9_9BASI|nr:hypothetical protein PSHT_04228 [Puccinia striiformis]
MNKDKDPFKIDLPDSDYKSVKEDLTSPKDSDNSSIKQYLPEVAKRKSKDKQEDKKMLSNIPQEGSRANNNLPMPTAKDYYQMAATFQQPPPQHMSPHDSKNPECAILTANNSNFQIWEEEVNHTLNGVFDTDVPFLSLDDNFALLGKGEAKFVITLFRMTISKDLQTMLDEYCYRTRMTQGFHCKLETKENTTFTEVSTVIQSACGQNKNKTVKSSTSYAPMDLDVIQAFRQSQGKYVHPNERNSQAQQGPPPAQSR